MMGSIDAVDSLFFYTQHMVLVFTGSSEHF